MQVLSTNISANGLKKVVVLGTGGTIAGTALTADALAYTSAQLGVETLLHGVPGLSGLLLELQADLLAEQVAQIDSKDMGFDVWCQLSHRVTHFLSQSEVAGVVITHGTDTLEETAYFLHHVLPREWLARKPVVITCAMRPATSREADGPQNLHDAIRLASHPGACGVVAVCASQIHAALHVQKVHPYRLDAFDSGDAGRVGQVSAGKVVLEKPWPEPQASPLGAVELPTLPQTRAWPRVEIVLSHAGATGALVDSLVSGSSARADAVRGIIVAGTGNGTVHHTLESALVRAQAAGIRVWRSTRCAYGAVHDLPGNVLPEVTPLPAVKARIALILELVGQDSRRLAGAAAL